MKDDGCQYHPSCLTCPFVMCVFEYPGGPDSYFGQKALVEAIDNGMSRTEAADKLGITLQSAHRRLRARNKIMSRTD